MARAVRVASWYSLTSTPLRRTVMCERTARIFSVFHSRVGLAVVALDGANETAPGAPG